MSNVFKIEKEKMFLGQQPNKTYKQLNLDYANRIDQYLIMKKSPDFIQQFIIQECIPVIKSKAGEDEKKLAI
jgi:hypothetical protein